MKAEVIALHQGETVIFSHRPVQGSVDSIELTCQQPDQRAQRHTWAKSASMSGSLHSEAWAGWKPDRRIEDRLRRRLVRNLLSAGYTACDDLGELPTNINERTTSRAWRLHDTSQTTPDRRTFLTF